MTIDQLIERLEEYRDLIGGDAQVRLMTQQNWPFENSITGLCSGEEINDAVDEDDPEDEGDVDDDASHACYHMRRAQAAGLVRKIGHQGGWVAID